MTKALEDTSYDSKTRTYDFKTLDTIKNATQDPSELPRVSQVAKPVDATHQPLKGAAVEIPWYLRMADLIIPLLVLGPCIAFLVGAPAAPAILIAFAALTTAAVLGPWIWRGSLALYRKLFKKTSYEPVSQINPLEAASHINPSEAHAAESPLSWEYQRKLWRPSTTRGFTWDARITLGAGGFAVLAIMIALIVLNPVGAVIAGTSVLELVSLNFVAPIIYAALAGTVFGAFVGLAWKRMAFFVAEHLKTPLIPTALVPEGNLARNPENTPAYVRLFGGALGGIVLATIISLSFGGLGPLAFASITLGIMGAALSGPLVARITERFLLGVKEDRLMLNPHVKAEGKYSVFKPTILNISWYARALFIGGISGLAIAGVVGGGAAVLFPVCMVTMGLALISPFVLKLCKKPLDWLAARHAPNERSTMENVWFVRIFAGAGAGAAVSAAFLALGLATPPIAIAIGLALPALAYLTPFLSTWLRPILPDAIFNPAYQMKQGISGDKRMIVYGQWYVRATIGALLGGLIATSLALFFGMPMLAPIVVLAMTGFMVLAQPIFKLLIQPCLKATQQAFTVEDAGNGRNSVTSHNSLLDIDNSEQEQHRASVMAEFRDSQKGYKAWAASLFSTSNAAPTHESFNPYSSGYPSHDWR